MFPLKNLARKGLSAVYGGGLTKYIMMIELDLAAMDINST